MLHIYPLFAINKRKYGFKAIKIDEFRQQTDMLIVVTINHSFFIHLKKYRLWQRILPMKEKVQKWWKSRQIPLSEPQRVPGKKTIQ